MFRPPPEGRTEWVTVRLSEVPEKTRKQVADRVIRTEGLVGIPALNLMIAAQTPVQDPEITVRAEVAERVLR